jgi:putative modified peptide
MTKKEGKGHQMDPKVVKRLLDGLTTDDDFRARFEANAQDALESIGYVPPTEAGVMSAGSCLQMQSGASLASADQISGARESLDSSLRAIQNFTAPAGLIA